MCDLAAFEQRVEHLGLGVRRHPLHPDLLVSSGSPQAKRARKEVNYNQKDTWKDPEVWRALISRPSEIDPLL